MTPRELTQELASGHRRPAYLLAGAEPLLREDAQRAIQAAVLGPEGSDFHHDRLDGESASAGELIDAVRALPVMAPSRLVVVREPEARRGKASLSEALPDAIAALPDDGSAVLVVVAAKIDKRSKWVKAFKEPLSLVACDPPRPGKALLGFIREEAKRQGLSLGPGAAEALAEATGPQLLLLRHELEKAALLAGDGETVTRAHVTAGVSEAGDDPIWDLTDAIGEGRSADALKVLAGMRASGAPPPVLLGSLASHFRKLARARHGGTLSGHPFAVKKLERQAGRYAPARLIACLRAIQEADELLKGAGASPPELTLERLVLGLSA